MQAYDWLIRVVTRLCSEILLKGKPDVVSPMITAGNHKSCHFQTNFKPQSRQATQKEAGNNRGNNRTP